MRFVPIVPNNVSRLNTLPQHSSRSMIFKPFIPKHMANISNSTSSKENINYILRNNYKENHNVLPSTQPRFNMKNPRSISLQVSHKQQEVKANVSASFVDKCNMNLLGNSLPKLPLHTIWTNNSLTDFEPPKSDPFRKLFSSNLNCSSQIIQNKNDAPDFKFQNKIPISPNTFNNSRYFKLPYSPPGPKLYPIAENMSSSYFTSDFETSFSTGQNLDPFEMNSFGINQPFNMDIWKNYLKM